MILSYRKGKIIIVGWSVYFVECPDGAYLTGLTRDIEKDMRLIHKGLKLSGFISREPNRLPVKLIFSEGNLSFREAYVKYTYMKQMNRYLKEKLIRTKKWPRGEALTEFFNKLENS